MNPAIDSVSINVVQNGYEVSIYFKDHDLPAQRYVFTTEAKLKKFFNNLFKKEQA